MGYVFSLNVVFKGGPAVVKPIYGGLRENGSSGTLQHGVVEKALCIGLVCNAGSLEQDVFSVREGSHSPFKAHRGAEGDVNGINAGVIDEVYVC